MTDILRKYKKYYENALTPYFGEDCFLKHFYRVPRSRYFTFGYCLKDLNKRKEPVIIELGTMRSFVDGQYEGCNTSDEKYWDPNNPEKWDWSAGCFTKLFSESLPKSKIFTVDNVEEHLNRCKVMTKGQRNISYHTATSEDFLKSFRGQVDLLYIDTGDMFPVEDAAKLHLREAKIIVKKDLVKKGGFILIDDVKNPQPKEKGERSDNGTAKYSIPYFLDNGYEKLIDQYQVILRKL